MTIRAEFTALAHQTEGHTHAVAMASGVAVDVLTIHARSTTTVVSTATVKLTATDIRAAAQTAGVAIAVITQRAATLHLVEVTAPAQQMVDSTNACVAVAGVVPTVRLIQIRVGTSGSGLRTTKHAPMHARSMEAVVLATGGRP